MMRKIVLSFTLIPLFFMALFFPLANSGDGSVMSNNQEQLNFNSEKTSPKYKSIEYGELTHNNDYDSTNNNFTVTLDSFTNDPSNPVTELRLLRVDEFDTHASAIDVDLDAVGDEVTFNISEIGSEEYYYEFYLQQTFDGEEWVNVPGKSEITTTLDFEFGNFKILDFNEKKPSSSLGGDVGIALVKLDYFKNNSQTNPITHIKLKTDVGNISATPVPVDQGINYVVFELAIESPSSSESRPYDFEVSIDGGESFIYINSFEMIMPENINEPFRSTIPGVVRNFWVTKDLERPAILVELENNDIYSFGDNRNGQSGVVFPNVNSSSLSFSPFPYLIYDSSNPENSSGDFVNLPENSRIVNVWSMSNSFIVKSSNGDIFVWGNNEYGQLGIEYVDFAVSKCSVAVDPESEYYNKIYKPCILHDSSNPENSYGDFKELESGRTIEYLWTMEDTVVVKINNGDVFSWGRNNYGQLGLAFSDGFSDVPTLILDSSNPENSYGDFSNLNENETIIDAWTTNNTVFTKSSMNDLYAWGRNDYGQVGNGGDEENSNSPIKIEIPNMEKVNNIWTSSETIILESSTNGLYSWGKNDFGQTGLNKPSIDKILSPTLLFTNGNPEISTIENIWSNENTFMAKIITGDVFSWGFGGYGENGDGGDINEDIDGTDGNNHDPERILNSVYPELSYGDYSSLDFGDSISDVYSMRHTNIIKATNGDIFSVGRSDMYQAGDGSSDTNLVPTLIHDSSNPENSKGDFSMLESGSTIEKALPMPKSIIALINNPSGVNEIIGWGDNNNAELGNHPDWTEDVVHNPKFLLESFLGDIFYLDGLGVVVLEDFVQKGNIESLRLVDNTGFVVSEVNNPISGSVLFNVSNIVPFKDYSLTLEVKYFNQDWEESSPGKTLNVNWGDTLLFSDLEYDGNFNYEYGGAEIKLDFLNNSNSNFNVTHLRLFDEDLNNSFGSSTEFIGNGEYTLNLVDLSIDYTYNFDLQISMDDGVTFHNTGENIILFVSDVGRRKLGLIIGSVIGTVLFVTILGVGGYFLHKKN